jgi:uncharacterized protein YqfA (UPF0365 family)
VERNMIAPWIVSALAFIRLSVLAVFVAIGVWVSCQGAPGSAE